MAKSDKFFALSENKRGYHVHMKSPTATNCYVIYFTPRSGSSWLTDILQATGKLSNPGECFNPNFLPRMAEFFGVADLDSYIKILPKRRNTEGVYGFQVTYSQLEQVFEDEDQFMSYFLTYKPIWLIREDVIAQAISLYKMVLTDVTHATERSEDQIARADEAFVYDADKIGRWLHHIVQMESRTEAMFDAFGVRPLRISYEEITAAGPAVTAAFIAANLRVTDLPAQPAESGHRKIATGKNREFAERFREDCAEQLAEIEATRRPRLDRIDRIY